MMHKMWIKLKKINHNHYQIKPECNDNYKSHKRVNFLKISFDINSEYLVAIDSKGNAHYIELLNNIPYFTILGNIGIATSIKHNPQIRNELLIGLNSGEVKICEIDSKIIQHCSLLGHKFPATNISFYKDYCLTSSHKEVIIWNLKSGSKAYQLKVNKTDFFIKKANLSYLGHIVVLYNNDTMQAWMLNDLSNDLKVNIKKFSMNNITDMTFTKDGQALIIAGIKKKIIVLNTYNWDLLANITLPDNFIGVKHLFIVPIPLDGGANKLIAILSLDCTLHFFDLNLECFLEISKSIAMIKILDISWDGRYLAYITREGDLNLINLNELIIDKVCKKEQSLSRLTAHKIDEHLQEIKETINNELRLERLIPILKEFGRYPEKHRALIWSHLLRLPSNRKAFVPLANKTTNQNLAVNIFKNYQLASRNKSSLLAMILDCLIQWCPILSYTQFLPNFIFPFIIIFQRNPLLAFELVLSVLLNYCQKWFEYHPLPPLNTLGIIENIFLEADLHLLDFLTQHGITSADYAWPLLQTVFSEVLTADEWLILWDHLITFQKPSLLLMCVVAFNICSKDIIISMAPTLKDFKQFYKTQSHVTAKDLLKIAWQLEGSTSERAHPQKYLQNTIKVLPAKGPYPPFLLKEFPEFLTEDYCNEKVDHIKEEKEIGNKYYQKLIEIKEKERLQWAKQLSSMQLHERGLKEIQKHKKVSDTPNVKQSSKYKTLKYNIDNLEWEVQNLLKSLKYKRSAINTT